MRRFLYKSYSSLFIGAGLAMNIPFTASAENTDNNAKNHKPNIIFVLADDMGWSDIGYHGGAEGFYETPNLDRLSSQGIRLDNFYPGGANSAPSRSCMMTGVYNTRTKIYTPGGLAKGPDSKMRLLVPNQNALEAQTIESLTELDPSFVSVAEMLHNAGYASSRMGKWHLGPDKQGFDESTSDGTDTSDKPYYNDPYATDRITAAALKYIEKNKDNAFFLYVPYFDVHTPLVAKPEIIEKYNKKWETWSDKSRKWNPKYAAKIEQVDTSVGKIYAKLQELGLDENTLFIFASDNGGVGFITDNSPLHGSKGNLYEGGIRTPAFAVWPKTIKAGTKSETAVSGIDLMPTFADVAGQEISKGQTIDGVSILPLLKGEKLKSRALIWHYPLYLTGKDAQGWNSEKLFPVYGTTTPYWRGVPSSAIQRDGWKLIYFYETEKYELYNIANDISEKEELSAKYPEKAKELYAELKTILTNADADIPSTLNPKFNPNQKEVANQKQLSKDRKQAKKAIKKEKGMKDAKAAKKPRKGKITD